MAAGRLQLLGQADVVREVVLAGIGAGQVAGVADRRLAEAARLQHRVDRDPHVLDPIERIEDPEEIDAGRRGLLDEEAHHVVGVVLVADAVGAAQQHLGQHVRHGLAQRGQALPRVLLEEPHGDVEGRAAPAFHGQKLGQQARVVGRDGDHVVAAHARRQQRLVGVAEGGVGEQQALLVEHPFGEARRAQLLEPLAVARRRIAVRQPGQRRQLVPLGRHGAAGHLRVAVDLHVADEAEQPGRPVAALGKLEQLRGLVDEAGGVVAVAELGVADHALEKQEVGGDAANPELAQRTVHAPGRLLRRRRPGGDLLQQRIVERRDQRAGIGRAAVEADAEAGGAAVGPDPPVVRHEVVLGILGRDPALQRVAVERDRLLGRHAAFRAADLGAGGDVDLRLDDVDAGHLLGDRMLDLDARIDLDEVEIAAVEVVEELDRAGVAVARGAAQAHGVVGQFGAPRLVEIGRRRALDDLLVAPLDRAVALEEVHQVAVPVADDLDLDVARPAHQLLQEDLVVAEGGLGLAPPGGDLLVQLALAFDLPHAAPAAAPARLQHERIADLRGDPPGLRRIVRQGAAGRDHGDARFLGERTGGDLAAQAAHDVGGRPDEGEARRRAGVGQLRLLREEAVARMDRVGAGVARDADHLCDVEIGLHRVLAFADQVAFVGLEAVQREAVLVGVDRDRLDRQLVGRADHADGDLAAVGDQELAERRRAPRCGIPDGHDRTHPSETAITRLI